MLTPPPPYLHLTVIMYVGRQLQVQLHNCFNSSYCEKLADHFGKANKPPFYPAALRQ